MVRIFWFVIAASVGLLACSAGGSNDVQFAADASEGSAQKSGSDASQGADVQTQQPPGDDAGEDATMIAHDAASEAAVEDATNNADALNQEGDAASDANVSEDAALPPTGSPCTTSGATQTEACGMCGTATRLCGLAANPVDAGQADAGKDASTDAGSKYVWLDWGACTDQVVGGCMPGTMKTVTCGFCGTLTETCANDCSIAVTECQGQVAGGCLAGDVSFTSASCGTGLEKERTCSNTCMWGDYSAGCSAPPTFLNVGGAIGKVNSLTATIPQTPTAQLPTSPSACPTSLTTGASTLTGYSYVVITNSLQLTANVSVWGSEAATSGAKNLATVTAAYAGSTPPASDTARLGCLGHVEKTCSDGEDNPTACLSKWSGLLFDSFSPSNDYSLTIAPGASVIIYTGGQTTSDYGDYVLNVRTESLN